MDRTHYPIKEMRGDVDVSLVDGLHRAEKLAAQGSTAQHSAAQHRVVLQQG